MFGGQDFPFSFHSDFPTCYKALNPFPSSLPLCIRLFNVTYYDYIAPHPTME